MGEAGWARQDSNLQSDRYERWKPVVFPLEVPIFIEFWRHSFSSFRFVSEAEPFDLLLFGFIYR